MALAKRLAAILLIESRRTFAQHLHPAPVERLAATTDTTARTCHNFDGMIGDMPFLTSSTNLRALPKPCAIPIFIGVPSKSIVALRMPSSPRSSSKSILGRAFFVYSSYAVRQAASITPPVVPKMTLLLSIRLTDGRNRYPAV